MTFFRVTTFHPVMWACCCLGTLSLITGTRADSNQFANYFQSEYQRHRERHFEQPNDAEQAMRFAQFAFEWGEFSANDRDRARIANEAIEVCRSFLKSTESSAAAHYYLALNLGQLARTKWLGALGIVKEMERHLQQAQKLQPDLDYAGASRALGRLYFRAPSWPTSVGNKGKAVDQLKEAIQIAPDYPGNHIFLIEMYLKQSENEAAENAVEAAAAILPTAKEKLSSPYWQLSWHQWSERWQAILNQLNLGDDHAFAFPSGSQN